MSAKNSSVSFCIAARSGSSNADRLSLSGAAIFRLRSCSHWPAKFSTSDWALGIVQHAAHLRVEVVPLTQRALPGVREQLVVGHAAPQEVRQPRGQLVIVQRADCPRDCWRLGIELDAKQEMGRDQHRLAGPGRSPCAKFSPSASASATSFSTRSTSAAVAGRRKARVMKRVDAPRGPAPSCLPACARGG